MGKWIRKKTNGNQIIFLIGGFLFLLGPLERSSTVILKWRWRQRCWRQRSRKRRRRQWRYFTSSIWPIHTLTTGSGNLLQKRVAKVATRKRIGSFGCQAEYLIAIWIAFFWFGQGFQYSIENVWECWPLYIWLFMVITCISKKVTFKSGFLLKEAHLERFSLFQF